MSNESPTIDPHAVGDEPRLYNVIIIKGYIDYIQLHYPDVDIDAMLHYAGMTRYMLSDSEYWFTQTQADRFYDVAVKITGNANLAREAGKFSVISGSSIIYKYIAGLVTTNAVFRAAEKITSIWTRGGDISVYKIQGNRAEVVSIPNEGVQEQQYQCENRIGVLEALGKVLLGSYARIEHPECIQHGARCCRYIISWDMSPFYKWSRIRNYLAIVGLLIMAVLWSFLPLAPLAAYFLGLSTICMALTWWAEHLENMEHIKNIEDTGKTADLLLEEIKSRYHDALLVQEIGQAGSHIQDIDVLLDAVMQILKKHLDFERGAVALTTADGSNLAFRAGFGYSDEIVQNLNQYLLNVQETSANPLVVAFQKQTPYLVNDIKDVMDDLSPLLSRILQKLGARAFICVPIIYEGKSLGILLVERIFSPKPMNQSEVSLLVGIAQQIAISINNARSFQKLQTSEERYRELVQNANSIILRIDKKGHIRFFNEFAQKFFDYTESEILGRHVMDTILQGENPLRHEFTKWLKGMASNPDRYMNTQTDFVLKNGRRVWIAWTNRIIKEDGVKSEILCIGNDITTLKMVEQEKRKLELELQRAQKMEAIGTMAGGVAHDLNNILSGLVSYPDLLLMKVPEDSPMVKPLTTIRKSGEKASAIVQDLLTLARRGVSVANVVQLNTVITNYLTSSEFLALKGYHPQTEVETRLGPDLKHIMGSEVHLSKSIMNLVTNAAEAMPNGGTITIATQNIYIDKPLIGYDHVVEGEYILLTVADTGVGIAQEDLPRIFEPFYTKKVMGRSGTGLGMAVIWSTVKDHLGYIDVHSTLGVGTSIDIYLPVTNKELPEEDALVDLNKLRGTETVLIVDDIPEQREIASELLSELGYAVSTVASGEEALEFLREKDVDLLILDMIMDPGIDGLDTFKRIHAFKPRQKAIIVSGYSESDRVKSALEMGVGTYVKKPYVLSIIGRAVRDELDRKPEA